MAADRPQVYSIAAHRGFADALVAGLVPRYWEEGFGLARLTLLLPSSRAVRNMSEAFIRHAGANDTAGLLMPRMAVVGDLDIDETLGTLFDGLDAGLSIPPAADPVRRWLRLAQLIAEFRADERPRDAGLLRQAFDLGGVMDRLLAEEVVPDDLLGDAVKDIVSEVSDHWVDNLRLFATVQLQWRMELEERGEVDAATRRNLLFHLLADRWKNNPPATPIIAAGVTSAAPALARLLRVITQLPQGAVVLPDFDLSLDDAVWEELGAAGAADAETPFMRGDAVTHPQYHLKLLLNRMGIARGEVQAWHRAGLGKGPPARSHAISSLFLPPQASKGWAALDIEKRRMAGVRLIESANLEEEAQAIALLVREALEVPEKRVSVITPDRGLAARVTEHLTRWNIKADDTAGRPLSQTPAGRLLLLLAQVAAEGAAPVPLVALIEHPLVCKDGAHEVWGREEWLKSARAFEMGLRGPRPLPGLAALRDLAGDKGLSEWWQEVEAILAPLMLGDAKVPLADYLDLLAQSGEGLCGDHLWSQEDGRALSLFVEKLRLYARDVGTQIALEDIPSVLRDAMDREAVRPPYGGHPRVSVYGLLEGRMTRADLVICAGLNEGVWPATPATDPILPPAVLRALGVPGAEFRIGLSAHDLAGAMGAAEVVLSRATRDVGGPVIASRFWLRVKALLGQDLLPAYIDGTALTLARSIDVGVPLDPHPRPHPVASAEQRRENISVTALDRLRSDPYQFYASKILSLRSLEGLDAEPDAAWQGTLAHAILEDWHGGKGSLAELAERHLAEMHAHPLMRALWRPRLMKALEWVSGGIDSDADRKPILFEADGFITVKGVTIKGKADRIDRCADGALAIVDYKTGKPPSGKEVEGGFAMQLGTLGLMAQQGAFGDIAAEPKWFEYWSLGKSDKSSTGFGYVTSPVKTKSNRAKMSAEDFLPKAEDFLKDALDRWILGDEPFTARLNPDAKVYNDFDHLMRLEEWMGREEEGG